MKDILESSFMIEMVRTLTNMYTHGWDERNGGNVSVLIDREEAAQYLDLNNVIREIPTNFELPELDGKIFLVSGTGKYFKNVQYAPDVNLGIVKIANGGKTAQVLWGYSDGGRFTSEFPAHMMSHAARLRVNPDNHVIMHCHPANLLTMTFVHSLDEREFTRTIWQMMTESLVIFPEGIGVLPWMVAGTIEIGEATAKKMKETKTVIWAHHGVYCAGDNLDEAFGLVETAEKAAEIYVKIGGRPVINTITDDNLRNLAKAFNLCIKEDYLN